MVPPSALQNHEIADPLTQWSVGGASPGPNGLAHDAQDNIYVALDRLHDHYVEKLDDYANDQQDERDKEDHGRTVRPKGHDPQPSHRQRESAHPRWSVEVHDLRRFVCAGGRRSPEVTAVAVNGCHTVG